MSSADVADRVEIAAKYDGYLDRQLAEADRLRKLEDHSLPADLDYESIPGLRSEARLRLTALRPTTVGQASRIFGVFTSGAFTTTSAGVCAPGNAAWIRS